MKGLTNWFVLILFLAPLAMYAQTNHNSGDTNLPKKSLAYHSERGPGAVPGPVQYSDDLYDLQFEYPCGDASGEAGAECDGDYIYTTKWNGTGQFFRYELDGTFLGSFTIAGAVAVRDLAYDGTYMYGAAANTSLFEMDFDNELLVSTISAAVATRAIAYDAGEDGFWANNWSDPPTLYNRNGQVLNSFNINGDESFYGFAYMDNDAGIALWGFSQTGNMNTLKSYSLPDGTWESDFDMTTILSMPIPGTDIAGGLYMNPDMISGTWTLGGIVQNICIWGIDMGGGNHIPIIEVNPLFVEEILGPDQLSTQFLSIYSMGCGLLTYDISINYLSSAPTPPKLSREEYKQAVVEHRKIENPAGFSERNPDAVLGKVRYSDENYDLQFEYPCADATGEAGIETDGSYLYTTKWNGYLFFRYGLDGTYYGSFQVPGAANVRDLAYDGNYFYGAAASTTIFEMDFEVQALVSTLTAPVVVRAIAYNDAEDGFWANNWSTDPTLFNRVGFIMNSFNINGDESFYGFAYMNNEIGEVLWGFSQTDNMNTIKRYNLPDGTWESDFDVTSVLSLPDPGTDIAGGLFFAHDINPSFSTLGGLVQNVCLWDLDMGFGCIHPDVGVTAIFEPSSGINLSASEPITFEIKNFGTNLIENLPYDVSWDGGYFEGIFAGPLANGQSAEITLPVTADLSTIGDYTFEACVYLDGDMNPDNDCKIKVISCMEPFLCVDGLYSNGCINGDGLIYWDFSNITMPDIPCSDILYDWYHNYTDQIHELQTGTNYTLTVQAGHEGTYFDVWIDLNDDLYSDNSELILNDAFCALENTNYQFSIFLPDSVNEGQHFLRFRTNWQLPIEESCESYLYGNCCDFSVNISHGGGDDWLAVFPNSGSILPGYMDTIFLDFNSAGLVPGEYLAELLISNNSTNNPELIVPVSLTVIETIPDPVIQITPDSLFFELYTDSLAFDNMMIENIGGGNLDYEMTIEYMGTLTNSDDTWLTADPVSGSIASGNSVTAHIMADATGMEGGAYFADIVITSNDPLNPLVYCHVTLLVNGDCPLPPPTNLDGVELEPNTVFLIWDEPEWQDAPNDFLYYNVYRDSLMVGTGIIPTTFTDTAVPPGYPSYVVSAFYEECEAFSDTLENLIVTKIPETAASGLSLYPNPANDFMFIKSTYPILEIGIMDNSGQRIYNRHCCNESIVINTSSFHKGIYFFRIESETETIIKKVLIE